MSETTSVKREFESRRVSIERAKPDDTEAICDIRDRAWLEAYPNEEHGITVDDVRLMAQGPDGEYVPRRIAYLKEQLSKEDGTEDITFVAKVDGEVIGYIDPGVDEQNRRRIGAIYVAPEAQGMGVGSKLMSQVLNWYGRDQDIFLEVVSYNQNAIDFYKQHGFAQTDNAVHKEEGRPGYLKELPQIEMVLRANPNSSARVTS